MKKKIETIISNLIYIFILIPCVIILIRISYQEIFFPNKIPDIFGWKMFMILDENMVEEINDGDLVFTKIVDINELKEDDIIAFRNSANSVTIHKILKIEDENGIDTNKKKITLIAKDNETSDTKYISEEKVEGILKHRIPKIGKTLYFIQKPIVVIFVSISILVIGFICICIAKELDKKETIKLEKEELEKIDKQKNKKSVSV